MNILSEINRPELYISGYAFLVKVNYLSHRILLETNEKTKKTRGVDTGLIYCNTKRSNDIICDGMKHVYFCKIFATI